MSSDTRRVFEVFGAVCDAPPERREGLLEELCDGDGPLRDRVQALLRADDDPERALDGQALDVIEMSVPRTGFLAGQSVIPGYRILRKIGEGGMGVVFEAEQENPRRRVALKVIRDTFIGSETLLRFDREARVLGWLNHRGIAQIYEAGRAGEQPYFAMELVDGSPLHRHADDCELSIEDRLELVARVCDALHHAHQKGVIHRDLKPSNILVDAGGQPKILDFGIARVTESDLTATTRLTSTGDILGTLAYMSPDQLLADPAELDFRSDVYSMGVIAYQLLSGKLPLDIRDKVVPEAARIIAEEEPTTLGTHDPRLRGDIETIVAKAIDREKTRRYASAEEFANDIRRYLSNEPIAARRATTLYQLRKFARRNRVLVGSLAVVSLSLIAGTVTSTLLYFEKEDERAIAESAKVVAQERLFETQRARAEIAGLLEVAEQAAEREAWLREEAEKSADRERELRGIAEEALVVQRELFDGFSGILRAPSSWTTGSDIRVIDLLEDAGSEIEVRFAHKPAIRATLLNAIGRTCVDLNMVQEGVDHQRRAYAAALEHGAFSVGQLATFEADLGTALLQAGFIEEGQRVSIAALDTLVRENPDDLATIQVVQIDLSRVMLLIGRYDDAFRYAHEAAEIGRELYPVDDDRRRGAVVVLAEVYAQLKRNDEALACCDELLGLGLFAPGEEDELTIRGMNTKAVVLAERGELQEAADLLERAIAGMKRLKGGEHGSFAIQTNSLATLLARLGRFDEAYSRLAEAHELAVRLWGENDHRVADMLGNWAAVLVADGRLEESLVKVRACTDALRASVGPKHIRYGYRMSGQAQTLAKLGRREEARDAFAIAFPILRDFGADGHPALIETLLGLAQMELVGGAADEARAGFAEALEIVERKMGSDSGFAYAARDGLALCALVAGDVQAAWSAMKSVHADAEASTKPSPWLRARINADRGLCLMASGRTEEGRPEYEAGLARLIELKGEGFPWVSLLRREAARYLGSDG